MDDEIINEKISKMLTKHLIEIAEERLKDGYKFRSEQACDEVCDTRDDIIYDISDMIAERIYDYREMLDADTKPIFEEVYNGEF